MKQRHHLPRHWCLSPSLCWCSCRGCCCLLVRTPGFLEVPLVAGGTPWTHMRSRSYIEKLELWCIVSFRLRCFGIVGSTSDFCDFLNWFVSCISVPCRAAIQGSTTRLSVTGGRLKFVACLFHEYSGLSFQRNATDSMVQANIDDVRNEFSNLKSLLVRDIDYSPPHQGWRSLLSRRSTVFSVVEEIFDPCTWLCWKRLSTITQDALRGCLWTF